MKLVTFIIAFLLLTPFIAVITDFKSGKIKNYFIYPSLFLSFILTFFVLDFYSNIENIIGLLIVIFFGYLFYINNKWGAGDGKYIMLIGLNSLIISHLLSFNVNIINILFAYIFGLLFVYTLFFVIINIKKIIKIKFKLSLNTKLLDNLYLIFFIYIISYFLGNYIGTEYIYIIIFLSITILAPFLVLINNKYLKYLVILVGITVIIVNIDYISFVIIGLIFFMFMYLQSLSEQIFDIIDVKNIVLIDIKQGNILTKKSLNIIKKDTGLEFLESPLQGDEVYNLIGKYKKLGKNPELIIYKDLKIGIIMYIGYILTIITYV